MERKLFTCNLLEKYERRKIIVKINEKWSPYRKIQAPLFRKAVQDRKNKNYLMARSLVNSDS